MNPCLKKWRSAIEEGTSTLALKHMHTFAHAPLTHTYDMHTHTKNAITLRMIRKIQYFNLVLNLEVSKYLILTGTAVQPQILLHSSCSLLS